MGTRSGRGRSTTEGGKLKDDKDPDGRIKTIEDIISRYNAAKNRDEGSIPVSRVLNDLRKVLKHLDETRPGPKPWDKYLEGRVIPLTDAFRQAEGKDGLGCVSLTTRGRERIIGNIKKRGQAGIGVRARMEKDRVTVADIVSFYVD